MAGTPLRLAFMGSPDFAVAVLSALLDAGHELARVYCQPPRAAGRGKQARPTPVQALAEARGLAVAAPPTLKDPDVQAEFEALGLDAAVVAAYGLILPAPILAAPRLGCLNAHASLLPRWRGAAPIQRAILAGDGETGVSIMQMDEGLDTGPVLMAEAVPITAETTGESLHDQLAALAARLMIAALDGLGEGRLEAVAQAENGVTYATKIEREEGRLDWRQPAAELERRVRAFTPWPGAWFEHVGGRVKVLEACLVPGDGAPGTVLDEALTIATADGAIALTRVQRAGKASMAAGDFLRGFPIAKGSRLA